MSPIALALNLTLAVLLLSALGVGLRLERRLKALKDGQAHFTGAVADLDRAARRAEAGLAELRTATEEAVDLLAGRIEKARELASRLEKLGREASGPASAPPRAALSRPAPPAARPAGDLRPEHAEAAAEDLVLRLTEREIAPPAKPARLEPRATARSRANVDDELFEAGPRLAGGRR